ncbi:MAG: hypothetical protein ACRC7P_00680 [Enterovibrio sp.]
MLIQSVVIVAQSADRWDVATMEGQASVPIYAIAAIDRDNKLLL